MPPSPPSTSRIFPLFLRLSSFRAPLFSPCKYAPSKSHKDLYSQREPSSPSNATHQEGYHLPLPFPLSLSLPPPLFSLFFPFFLLSRSLFHFLFLFFSLRVFHHHEAARESSVYLCRRETFLRITKSRGLLRGPWRWRARPRCENTLKFVVKDETESNHFLPFLDPTYTGSVSLSFLTNLNIFQFNIISF